MEACLGTLLPQVAALEAELIVVDDGSRDETVRIATDAGIDVLPVPESRGPYAARNLAWHRTRAEVVVFTDVRCRAEHGWLDAFAEAFADDPALAIAAGVTRVDDGATLARRVMHAMQPMDPRRRLGHPFLPVAPAANLAVRRTALEAVGGFWEVRSGADDDLCWRLQLLTNRRLHIVEDAVMTWEPRPTLRACTGQWFRYGLGHPALYRRFEPFGLSLPAGPRLIARTARSGLRDAARARRGGSITIELGMALMLVSMRFGEWIGTRRLPESDPSTPRIP